MGATEDEVADMQRELVRIGIDRPAAYAVGSPSDWASDVAPLSSYPRSDHAGMAAALAADPSLPMLDLRRNSEWNDGHVAGAKHVPLHELRGRLDEVRSWAAGFSGPVWIYCGSGFRASVGGSILEAAGVSIVHVDDDFPNAAKAGLQIVTPGHLGGLGESYAD